MFQTFYRRSVTLLMAVCALLTLVPGQVAASASAFPRQKTTDGLPNIMLSNLSRSYDATSRQLTGSFDALNQDLTTASDIYFQVTVSAALGSDSHQVEPVVVQSLSSTTFGAAQLQHILYSLVLPNNLPKSTYYIDIAALNHTGLVIDRIYGANDLAFTASGSGTFLNVSKSGIPHNNTIVFPLSGPTFTTDDTPQAYVELSNPTTQPITAYPHVTVYPRSQNQPAIATFTGEAVTVAAQGSQSTYIDLPSQSKPESYLAIIEFKDQSGATLTGPQSFRWIIGGAGGKIIAYQSSTKANGFFRTTVTGQASLVGSPDQITKVPDAVLRVTVKDDSSTTLKTQDFAAGNLEQTISSTPYSLDLINSRLSDRAITIQAQLLAKDGTVLDTTITHTTLPANKNLARLVRIIVLSILFIITAVLVFFIRKRMRREQPVGILTIIAILGASLFVILAATASAFAGYLIFDPADGSSLSIPSAQDYVRVSGHTDHTNVCSNTDINLMGVSIKMYNTATGQQDNTDSMGSSYAWSTASQGWWWDIATQHKTGDYTIEETINYQTIVHDSFLGIPTDDVTNTTKVAKLSVKFYQLQAGHEDISYNVSPNPALAGSNVTISYSITANSNVRSDAARHNWTNPEKGVVYSYGNEGILDTDEFSTFGLDRYGVRGTIPVFSNGYCISSTQGYYPDSVPSRNPSCLSLDTDGYRTSDGAYHIGSLAMDVSPPIRFPIGCPRINNDNSGLMYGDWYVFYSGCKAAEYRNRVLQYGTHSTFDIFCTKATPCSGWQNNIPVGTTGTTQDYYAIVDNGSSYWGCHVTTSLAYTQTECDPGQPGHRDMQKLSIGIVYKPTLDDPTLNPAHIPYNHFTNLSWGSQNADYVQIANSTDSTGNPVWDSTHYAPSDNITYSKLKATTTYTLRACNSVVNICTDPKSVTVTVDPPASGATVILTANKNNIAAGDTIKLSWTVSGASTLAIYSDAGEAYTGLIGSSATGSRNVNPLTSRNYWATVCDSGNVCKDSAKVAINVHPTVSLTIDKTTGLYAGAAPKLTITSKGALSAGVSPDTLTDYPNNGNAQDCTFTATINGSTSGCNQTNLQRSHIYTAWACSGANKTGTCWSSPTQTVTVAPYPTISATAGSAAPSTTITVNAGEVFTLTNSYAGGLSGGFKVVGSDDSTSSSTLGTCYQFTPSGSCQTKLSTGGDYQVYGWSCANSDGTTGPCTATNDATFPGSAKLITIHVKAHLSATVNVNTYSGGTPAVYTVSSSSAPQPGDAAITPGSGSWPTGNVAYSAFTPHISITTHYDGAGGSTIHYSYWLLCSNLTSLSISTTSVSVIDTTTKDCGPKMEIGPRLTTNGADDTPVGGLPVSYTSAGTYYLKVIVEQGFADPVTLIVPINSMSFTFALAETTGQLVAGQQPHFKWTSSNNVDTVTVKDDANTFNQPYSGSQAHANPVAVNAVPAGYTPLGMVTSTAGTNNFTGTASNAHGIIPLAVGLNVGQLPITPSGGTTAAGRWCIGE